MATQGFEKRFFMENFRKYFGNDVKWWESVDMNSVRLQKRSVANYRPLTISAGTRGVRGGEHSSGSG